MDNQLRVDDDHYLVEFPARSHQIELFPYDWRYSAREAASRLVDTLVTQAERTSQPPRIVAHSMGGLVLQRLILRQCDPMPGLKTPKTVAQPKNAISYVAIYH